MKELAKGIASCLVLMAVLSVANKVGYFTGVITEARRQAEAKKDSTK